MIKPKRPGRTRKGEPAARNAYAKAADAAADKLLAKLRPLSRKQIEAYYREHGAPAPRILASLTFPRVLEKRTAHFDAGRVAGAQANSRKAKQRIAARKQLAEDLVRTRSDMTDDEIVDEIRRKAGGRDRDIRPHVKAARIKLRIS